MARIVKPELVASIQAGMPGVSAPQPNPEQEEALAALVEGLDGDQIDALLGPTGSVSIVIRKPPPSERWVRVD